MNNNPFIDSSKAAGSPSPWWPPPDQQRPQVYWLVPVIQMTPSFEDVPPQSHSAAGWSWPLQQQAQAQAPPMQVPQIGAAPQPQTPPPMASPRAMALAPPPLLPPVPARLPGQFAVQPEPTFGLELGPVVGQEQRPPWDLAQAWDSQLTAMNEQRCLEERTLEVVDVAPVNDDAPTPGAAAAAAAVTEALEACEPRRVETQGGEVVDCPDVPAFLDAMEGAEVWPQRQAQPQGPRQFPANPDHCGTLDQGHRQPIFWKPAPRARPRSPKQNPPQFDPDDQPPSPPAAAPRFEFAVEVEEGLPDFEALRQEPPRASAQEGVIEVLDGERSHMEWTIKASRLTTYDQQVASPPFLVHGSTFQALIRPVPRSTGHRKSGFNKSKGKGNIHLKCQQPGNTNELPMSIRVWMKTGGQPSSCQHDFVKKQTCVELSQEGGKSWDFRAAVDPQLEVFKICIEISPANIGQE